MGVTAVLAAGAKTPVEAAETRIGLVIGNAAYRSTAPLRSPGNDAEDMAVLLSRLGFKVVLGLDLDKAALDRKIAEFAEALSGADVGVFFYGGHGLQVGGRNYLVPVDATLLTARSLDVETVHLDLVQRVMEREAKTSIIFLDACRDNPLARNLARALGTRSSDIPRGLATIEAGVGTLISFSTQPGNVALDGDGRNSPFAAALLDHLEDEESITDVLISVRNDVVNATSQKQVPWEHSALRANVYFKNAKVAAVGGPAPAASSPLPSQPAAAEKPQVVAALPGSTDASPVARSTEDLAESVQKELKRVGCYTGAIDGKWGDGTRAALDAFAAETKVALSSDEPTEEALDALTARKESVCKSASGASSSSRKADRPASSARQKSAARKPSKGRKGGDCKPIVGPYGLHENPWCGGKAF